MIIQYINHSDYWLNNLKHNLLTGAISICNYWCAPSDVSDSINVGIDDIAITTESGSIQMAGRIVAYGKTNCSGPTLLPNDSGRTITVEDVYHMELQNNSIVLPSGNPTLSAMIGKNISNENCYDLNGLSQTDDIRDFVSIINESFNSPGAYERSSEFAYLLFKPYLISWFNIKNPSVVARIKAFNGKYQRMVSPELLVNERNGAVLSRKRSF